MQTINILGTDYSITVKKYSEDEAFERSSIDGYCNGAAKQIVVCDMATCKGWEHETPQTIDVIQRETLRHEIVHAFFYESGLARNSFTIDGAWAQNEEMVDWIALQGPKLYDAWYQAGCL